MDIDEVNSTPEPSTQEPSTQEPSTPVPTSFQSLLDAAAVQPTIVEQHMGTAMDMPMDMPMDIVPVDFKCPPPLSPEVINQNPHANINISYAFYETASIKILDNGDVDTSTSMNFFSTSTDPGIFTIKSTEASVSAVTLSIVDVLAKIIDNVNNPAVKTLKNNLVKVQTFAGRDNVAPAYNYMHNTFITPLTTPKNVERNGLMTPQNIKSFFIGPSAIKAIMDSGPLGEVVLNAIDYNLVPCFSELAINENDITEYLEILKETGLTIAPLDVIKNIDFWLVLEYCRVFQLVSSDIIGAINGLIPLRAIIDNTAFTGFINIPRGSGGQIALGSEVCLYSLFLFNALYPPAPEKLNFFTNVPNYSTISQTFNEKIKASTEFIRSYAAESNIIQIEQSITRIMSILKTNMDGILKGSKNDKTNKIVDIYNTYKLITIYAEFIKDPANATFFKKAFDALNNSYTINTLENLHNSAWITWVCFQLTRYQQTQKVYVEKYEPPNTSIAGILVSFNERKHQYCSYIKDNNNRNIFAQAWYKALSQVYIYEAFCGHDNNSLELTQVAKEVFGNEGTPAAKATSTSRGQKKQKIEQNIDENMDEMANEEQMKIDEKQKRTELTDFLNNFITADKYVNRQVKVIERILKESKCTAFSEAINVPYNTILWTVGTDGPQMIDTRDLNAVVRKIPMNYTSSALLDNITGEKTGENKMVIVVDLAKYTPETIMRERGLEEISLLLTNKLVEKDLLSNMPVITVHIPMFSGADAASFSKPNSAVYSTGTLRLPIDVGNNITMVITFKTGDIKLTDETELTLNNNLYIKESTPDYSIALDISKLPAEIDPNFLICFNYFLKITQDNIQLALSICERLKPLFKTVSQLSKLKTLAERKAFFSFEFEKTKLNAKNFPDFLVQLLTNIHNKNVPNKTDYNDYYLFLQAAIPIIRALNPPEGLFKDGGVGTKWKQLIENMANTNLSLANAFVETIKLVPAIIGKTGGKIEECEVAIKASLDFLSRIEPKCPTLSTTLDAAIQTKMVNAEETFCILTIETGKIHIKYANKADIRSEVRAEGRAELPSSEDEERGRLAFLQFVNDPLNERKRKHVSDFEQIQNRIDKLNRDLIEAKENLQEALDINDEEYQGLTIKQIDLITTTINKYKEKLSVTPQGGGGGLDDETIDKLEEELAKLEKAKEEMLISKVRFTSGPISEVELTKLALVLGPELFEQVALAQTLDYKVVYNKLFDINAGKVPFVENKEVIVSPADIILPEGTTIDYLNNKLVTVKFVEGKYYVKDAETFFNEFTENYNALSSVVENVQEIASNVVDKVEDIANNVVDKVEDMATEVMANLEKPTDMKLVPASLVPASPYVSAVAAAAGGSKKKTKKRRSQTKKTTKRIKNKHKKNKKLTNRYRNKKPRKTKRRN